jgi:hypothetical protein
MAWDMLGCYKTIKSPKPWMAPLRRNAALRVARACCRDGQAPWWLRINIPIFNGKIYGFL